MDLKLQNKVALVAASSDGLGFATALQLAKEGARVVINGRNQDKIDTAVNKIKSELAMDQADNNIIGIKADLTEADQIETLVQQTVQQFDGIDILITNAGGPPAGLFEQMDEVNFTQAFNLTLMSAVRLIRESLPFLKKSDMASVLAITSYSVKQPVPKLIMSNIFRPAVVGLTKTLAQEYGPQNIRVNSILPGWIGTERTKYLLTKRAEMNASSFEAEQAAMTDMVPLGKMGTPAEFADAAAFLVSPRASYIHGTTLLVDGGIHKGLL